MLISVVTAVYNRVDTVAEALASVQAQSHVAREHVVQDGGSTDGTLEAIRAAADASTRVASGPDAGLYDAINRGIARARGEVVGLMHSDDVFATPDVLAQVAAAFEDPDVDAVYGDLDYVSARDTGRVIRRWRSGDWDAARLRAGWMPPHPTLYLRRRVFERHGSYDTSYRIAADYDAVLRYFSQPGFRAVYIPKVFVKMRVGGESNGSLGRILRKSREDYRALRSNGIGGLSALARKNVSKIGQFISRDDAAP
jgi:glycosyltransferase